jgi:hypothetical protein
MRPTLPAPTDPRPHPAWRRGLAAVLALAVLALVFMAYRDPHTVLGLAGRVWTCF